MREGVAACGLVLNALYEPCRLPALHEGFHESLAGANHYGQSIIVEWWTPRAASRERRYSIEEPNGRDGLTTW